MKQKLTGTLKIGAVFIGGVIVGAVLTNLLHMHVRAMYREYMRMNLMAEQECLAGRAIRQNDKWGEVVHRWIAVYTQTGDGFRIFRKEWDKDMERSFFFPLHMAVLDAVTHSIHGTPEMVQGLSRGQLALSLESIGAREEADKQWQAARTLTNIESIEIIRKAALTAREEEKENAELHRQAEKAILGDDPDQTRQ